MIGVCRKPEIGSVFSFTITGSNRLEFLVPFSLFFLQHLQGNHSSEAKRCNWLFSGIAQTYTSEVKSQCIKFRINLILMCEPFPKGS